MTLEYACTVNIGVRETNDDRALINMQILDNETADGTISTPNIAVVCDGCGGYAGGGTAAETVLGTLAAEEPADLLDPGKLRVCLNLAGERLENMKRMKPELREMCSTVVGIVFGDTCSTVFHLGDSRLYRYDGYALAQLTTDHSEAQRMVDFGYITRDEIRTYPGRNRIDGCMGRNLRPPELQPELSPAYPGDVYLLCSDGLWEAVKEPEMKEILSQDISCREISDRLVSLALRNGSDDNITALICRCTGKKEKPASSAFVLD